MFTVRAGDAVNDSTFCLLLRNAITDSLSQCQQTKALRKYYAAILLLKGLSGQGLHTYSGPSRSSLSSQPRITEVPSNDARSDGGEADDAESDDGHQAEEESESEEEEEEVEENAQHYSGDGVKKLICQCYVNMAICHAKNNAWDKCKRNAEE